MTGFGRSNSLSINTGGGTLFGNSNAGQAQPSAGLFGSSSKPAATGGLFGSTAQPQSGGLFGAASTTAASQPPQTNSLFGASQQASQPQSAGLFGNLNKPAATSTSTGGGLFGSAAPQQPQQTGGLFGGALGGNTQNQNQAQTQTPQSGGLFSLGQASKPSLFGSANPQQTSTPSLFGNTNAQQSQAAAPSIGSTQQAQPQQNSLFGGMASQNRPLGGLGNASANQQPIQIQTLDSIKGTTRFSQLHPDIQTEIQKLDNEFQFHMSNAQKCRETMNNQGQMIELLAPDVAMIEEVLSTVETGLQNDSASIVQLKELVKKDAEDAAMCFRAIENHKLPPQYHYGNRTRLNASSANAAPATSLDQNDDPSKPVDLVGYFSRRANDMSTTLDLYQRQIREIEAHLRTMEAGTVEKAQQLTGSRNGARDQRRELVEAMKAIEGAILDAAKKVGKTRDLVVQHTLGGVGGA